MATQRELQLLRTIAERHMDNIFDSVYCLLQGIALQNVWRTNSGELVYTQDVDIDTLYNTALDVYMGDYALFCQETSENGVDVCLAETFDEYAIRTVRAIKQRLGVLQAENRGKSKALACFIEIELQKYCQDT